MTEHSNIAAVRAIMAHEEAVDLPDGLVPPDAAAPDGDYLGPPDDGAPPAPGERRGAGDGSNRPATTARPSGHGRGRRARPGAP